MTYNDVTQSERTISGALALAMHLLFFALIVSGVSWQKKQPDSAFIVDLWNNLPPLPQPKVEEPPPPEVKPAPEPPQPMPKPEAKPAPKPDIALKEKLETKKREDEKKRQTALLDKQEKEAKAKLLKEQDEALKKIAEREATQAAAQAKLIDEYKRRIRDKIRRFIVEPPNLQGNPEVEFDVVLLPGGEVLGVKLKKGSAIAAYDNAVERAILKAQPLPLPPDPGLFKDFRELTLKFRPKE